MAGALLRAQARGDQGVAELVGDADASAVGAEDHDPVLRQRDANGLPLVVGISAGNVHDSEGLKPMIAGHQTQHDPYCGRYFKAQRLHADEAYDLPHLRRWLWGKHFGVRIARKGIESSER